MKMQWRFHRQTNIRVKILGQHNIIRNIRILRVSKTFKKQILIKPNEYFLSKY